MTHVHYFIQTNGTLDSCMKIYIVTVGTTKQSKRDSEFLQSCAAARQDYYEVRSQDTSDFVCKLIKTYMVPQSNVQRVSARDLVRSIKAAVSVPLTRDSLRNGHHCRKNLDSLYYFLSNFR